jgi:Replicase family/Primase C terminal 1 (PriCT-1)
LSTLGVAKSLFPKGFPTTGKAWTTTALERFARTLPFRVHATNNFQRGTYYQTREEALDKAEIAPDPPGWITALRFDVDTENGGAAWIDAELPPPNLVILNPQNGHAHLVYLLGGWVRTDFGSGSLKVVRYAAAIERAYAAALGADIGYSGRFQHNPLSGKYATQIGRNEPYSLDELAQYVELDAPLPKRRSPLGISRNVELFDRLRHWAYAAVADWRTGNFDEWHAAVRTRAGQIAADIGAESPRGPLPENEVGHTAKSVAKWVWNCYTGDAPPLLKAARAAAKRERERARQASREATRGRSRRTREEYTAQARQRLMEAGELRKKGLSLRAIAKALCCSLGEICRLLCRLVQGSPAPSDFGPVAPAQLGQISNKLTAPAQLGQISNKLTAPAQLGQISNKLTAPAQLGQISNKLTAPAQLGESSIAYIQRRIRQIVAEIRGP